MKNDDFDVILGVIKADPGYEIIEPTIEDGRVFLYKCPVIAWKITGRGEHTTTAVPVGLEMLSNEYAILRPDGVIVEPDLCEHANLRAFERAMIERHKTKRQPAAAVLNMKGPRR